MADILVRDDDDHGAVKRFRDMGDGTWAEVQTLPSSLITGTTNPRIRVDAGETGFFERRMFRAYSEFTNILANGSNPVSFRFTSPINFILWEQTLEVDQGAVRGEVFTGAVTPSGVWTPITPIGQNRMTEAPLYNPQVTIETGGSFTGGTAVDLLRVRTAAVNNQATNVGNAASSERGLPAGTYYIRLSTLAGGLPVNDTAQGVYGIRWEERP